VQGVNFTLCTLHFRL